MNVVQLQVTYVLVHLYHKLEGTGFENALLFDLQQSKSFFEL